ncbi:hypothetical protein [Alsobacter metallidurans]|nr:hypothetical protein [Alsobacter metallidurans]
MSGAGALGAECRSAFGQAGAAALDAFSTSPTGILTSNPQGGGLLVKQVRDLLLANTDLAQSMLALAATANPDQRSSIGAAMGQVTLACAKAQPEVAQRLQEVVLAVANPDVLSAFRQATGDVSTAAVGVAASSAPASSPLGGANASLVGGGVGEAGSNGAKQGGGIASLAISGARFAQAAQRSFVSSANSVVSSSRPPVVTVPTPEAGTGLSGLAVAGALAAWWRLRRRKPAEPGRASKT